MTKTVRVKKNKIKPGRNHLRPDFVFFSGITSPVFGMVKKESDRDDCTSILFKAFRMELNLIFLYPNSMDCSSIHNPSDISG